MNTFSSTLSHSVGLTQLKVAILVADAGKDSLLKHLQYMHKDATEKPQQYVANRITEHIFNQWAYLRLLSAREYMQSEQLVSEWIASIK